VHIWCLLISYVCKTFVRGQLYGVMSERRYDGEVFDKEYNPPATEAKEDERANPAVANAWVAERSRFYLADFADKYGDNGDSGDCNDGSVGADDGNTSPATDTSTSNSTSCNSMVDFDTGVIGAVPDASASTAVAGTGGAAEHVETGSGVANGAGTAESGSSGGLGGAGGVGGAGLTARFATVTLRFGAMLEEARALRADLAMLDGRAEMLAR
jgi:hypothetical protein